MSKYTQVEKDAVTDSIGAGEVVIVCDFKTMRCCGCENMTMGAIRSYIDSEDAVFFTKTEVENES